MWPFSYEAALRPDLEWLWLEPVEVVEIPMRQALVPLQRRQILSPAQALSKAVPQLRQVRSRRLKVREAGSSTPNLARRMIPSFI
ncbi:hypothetical protein [Dongia sp. agr-C8]